MLDALFSFIANSLAFFFELGGNHNYAIAIALLTIFVTFLTLPLTIKGTRSSLALQKIAPELKRIQDEYKNDREAMNREAMKLYKEHKANPVSGCLPFLLQLPVFLVLYNVILGLTRRNAQGIPDPKYIDHSSELYKSIVDHGGQMLSFGMDMAVKPITAIQSGFISASPYVAMVVAMVVIQYFQQRQVLSKQPQQDDSPQAAAMRSTMKIMPIMIGAISFSIPAGVVLYWLVNSGFRFVQQEAIYRFDPALQESNTSSKKNEPPKPEYGHSVDGDKVWGKSRKNNKKRKGR